MKLIKKEADGATLCRKKIPLKMAACDIIVYIRGCKGDKRVSKKKIENPKVFISYAWGTEQYQEKVLAFATQLMGDGVDVVLDKWDLSEGNDTYAFMEKCATDPSITNVLMLLDPIYASKADAHVGGVGTETQIISAKVYQEVTQDKFIPIVFERDENGQVCKPTYLQGRLHFDLSLYEKYYEEYLRLVKTLYGEEVYHKPQLGTKPAWVEKTETVEIRKRTSFEVLKNMQPDKARKKTYAEYIERTLGLINQIADEGKGIASTEGVIPFYKKLKSVRTEYLTLLEYSIYVTEAEQVLASKLETVAIAFSEKQGVADGLVKNFLHELFLYTVAYFLKNEDYEAAGYILGRTYYNPNKYNDRISGYDLFYSGRYDSMDRAMNARDQKKYISGTATYWIENIDAEHCSKEQFLLADLICYNYSIYGKDNLIEEYWFPMTYIYDNEYASVLGTIGKKLISREFIARILQLFGYETIEDFKNKLNEVAEKIKNREYREIRYPEAWREAALLNFFIDLEKIATAR